jgi:hypothetical protein
VIALEADHRNLGAHVSSLDSGSLSYSRSATDDQYIFVPQPGLGIHLKDGSSSFCSSTARKRRRGAGG